MLTESVEFLAEPWSFFGSFGKLNLTEDDFINTRGQLFGVNHHRTAQNDVKAERNKIYIQRVASLCQTPTAGRFFKLKKSLRVRVCNFEAIFLSHYYSTNGVIRARRRTLKDRFVLYVLHVLWLKKNNQLENCFLPPQRAWGRARMAFIASR